LNWKEETVGDVDDRERGWGSYDSGKHLLLRHSRGFFLGGESNEVSELDQLLNLILMIVIGEIENFLELGK
jgi:hypothetical protein